MVQFYERTVVEEVPRAAAVRQTQLAMIEDGNEETAKPYYWAPFVLVGR